jgi:hypothetical protein
VLSLQSIPSFDAQHTQKRCVIEQGFSLHANVRCDMNQRKKLEQLCRYITRSAIANERLKLNTAGRAATQEPVLGRYRPHREIAAGVHATPRRLSPASQAQPHSLPWTTFDLVVK